jgi:hypothetical protein
MGNEGARSAGLEQAPDKFVNTIRMFLHSRVLYGLMFSWDD